MSASRRITLRSTVLLLVLTVFMAGLSVLSPATQQADAAVKARPGTKLFGIKVIAEAKKHRKKQYRYGATGPSAFDCSGYTKYVIKRATGKNLPRTSGAQYKATRKVAKKNVRPGDLVFFKSSSGRVYHVAIYAGGGKIWHASNPRTDIKLAKIWTSRWSAGRVR
jgi:cell wall-associated NlpC family hydrolase